MHHRTTKDVQSGMRTKKNLHGMEHTNFTRSSSRKDTASMSTKQNFFRSDVTTEAKNTASDLPMDSKERVYMVDSGASLHVMGLSSLNHIEKKTTRQSSKILDMQTASGIVVSDTQAKVYIKKLWRLSTDTLGEIFSVIAIVGKIMQWTWSFLFVADKRCSQIIKRRESNRIQHRKLRPFGCSYQTKTAPSFEFSTAKGILERENEVADTMLDPLEPCAEGGQNNTMHLPQLRQLEVPLSMKSSKKNLLVMRFPRLSPMRAEIHWQEIPRARKVSSVPNQEEPTMCTLIIRKTTIAKSFRRQHEQGVE